MTSFDNNQLFHSGTRLQKLRELQGSSVTEIAEALKLNSAELEVWERDGVPKNNIKSLCHYFEVSDSMFSEIVNNQTELDRLAEKQLFSQGTSILHDRLIYNKKKQSASLDLSGLSLDGIPSEVFTFSWLTTLNISDNKINKIPSNIILLKHLKSLDIRDNLLTHIPGIINNLIDLDKFYFEGNPLASTQSTLLPSAMKLNDYQEYLNDTNTNITIVALEQLTSENLQRLDHARDTVEKSQSLIVLIEKTDYNLITKYKNISNILYISESQTPEHISEKIKPLIHKQNSPIFIIFNNTLKESQRLAINNYLFSLFPKIYFLLNLLDNDSEFTILYEKTKNLISNQNKIPCIKIKSLTLDNIGVYEHLEVSFDTDITVFIGLNGLGKTTLLKAISLAILGPKKAEFNDTTAANLLRITGKNNSQTLWKSAGKILLCISINDEIFKNTIHLTYNSNTEKVNVKGSRFDELFNKDDCMMNLMLGISEKRNANNKNSQYISTKERKPKPLDLLAIISNDNDLACINNFTTWLSNLALLVHQGKDKNQKYIDTCFTIFSALMQEPIKFSGITKVDPLELWVEHQNPKQLVPLRLISQGYQAIMGWVGLIIQRMCEAYEDTLQPLHQPAIIIIDEIDQLLHIKWQQKILKILAKEFFPNTQWIITTHSPMIITGLDQEQVIQLHQRDGNLVAENTPVDLWLWQYGDLLNYLFEVPPEKPDVQEQQLIKQINTINAESTVEMPTKQKKKLEKLKIQLEKTQKSREFIDDLYKEQKKLRTREQELTTLIEQLNQQLPKA